MEEGGRIEECRVFWIAEMEDILRTGKLEQRAAFRKQELFFFVDTARTCRGRRRPGFPTGRKEPDVRSCASTIADTVFRVARFRMEPLVRGIEMF